MSENACSLKDLCPRDKQKVSNLIRQVVELKQVQAELQQDLDAARKVNHQCNEKLNKFSSCNKDLVKENSSLKAKLLNAITLLRVYQHKVYVLEASLNHLSSSQVPTPTSAARQLPVIEVEGDTSAQRNASPSRRPPQTPDTAVKVHAVDKAGPPGMTCSDLANEQQPAIVGAVLATQLPHHLDLATTSASSDCDAGAIGATTSEREPTAAIHQDTQQVSHTLLHVAEGEDTTPPVQRGPDQQRIHVQHSTVADIATSESSFLTDDVSEATPDARQPASATGNRCPAAVPSPVPTTQQELLDLARILEGIAKAAPGIARPPGMQHATSPSREERNGTLEAGTPQRTPLGSRMSPTSALETFARIPDSRNPKDHDEITEEAGLASLDLRSAARKLRMHNPGQPSTSQPLQPSQVATASSTVYEHEYSLPYDYGNAQQGKRWLAGRGGLAYRPSSGFTENLTDLIYEAELLYSVTSAGIRSSVGHHQHGDADYDPGASFQVENNPFWSVVDLVEENDILATIMAQEDV